MSLSETEFNRALFERVRELRQARGWTAEEMATALGITADRYRKYESRTPIPHFLIERFALIVGRDLDYVLTGKAARRCP
jgi:transcriptional regulator with XRE-family HTH domain